MIKVLIFGCGGLLGRVLADLAQGSDDIEVAARLMGNINLLRTIF